MKKARLRDLIKVEALEHLSISVYHCKSITERGQLMKMVKSDFHDTEEYLCEPFYKPVSRPFLYEEVAHDRLQ